MSGFRFPPPPPPPPAPAGQDQQVRSYASSGSRGRARGRTNGHERDQSGRRGESTAPSGSQHGAPQQMSYGRARQPSGLHGQANVYEQRPQPGQFDTSRVTTNTGSTMFSNGSIPPGSYVNPAFAQPGMAFAGGNGWPSAPMGGQDHGRDGGAHARNSQSTSHADAAPARLRIQERQGGQPHAGQKRKFHAIRGTAQSHPGAHENSITNPITPHFGGSIVPEKPHHLPEASRHVKISGRPHAKSLGLTPQASDPGYSSSSDSDENEDLADEEATLANALGSQLMFHDANGEMRTLTSAADLLAWRRARRSNFPTRDNVDAKDAEKRRYGAMRRRLLVDARDALQAVINFSQSSSTRSAQVGNGTGLSKAVKTNPDRGSVSGDLKGSQERSLQVEVPRKHPLQNSSASRREESERGSAADPVTSSSAIQAAVYPLDSDSDDDSPKETTAKQRPKAETALTTCRYFAASGYCRDGSACRFKHELPSRLQEGRKHTAAGKPRSDPYAPVLDAPDQDGKKSIHQRLLEREQEGEDQLALQVIKYLGSANFFAAE